MPPQLRSLTGIRAIAALMVLAVHLTFLWRNGRPYSDLNYVSQQGGVGVSLFFILSGFILTYSHREGDRPRAFWRRRVARIIPAYVVAVALSIPVSAYEHRKSYLAPTAFTLTLLQAWIPKATWFSAGNEVGWSLSAEAFFYAVFPLIVGRICRLGRSGRGVLLALTLAYALAVPLIAHPNSHEVAHQIGWRYWIVYIAPSTRIAEFVVGILLCTFYRDRSTVRIPLLLASLLAVVSYVLDAHVPAYLGLVVVTLVPFSMLILACAQFDTSPTRGSILSSGPLVALGRWSFAFFLVHQLGIRVLGQAVLNYHFSTAAKAVCAPLLVVAAWICAWILYRVVEMPFERRLRGSSRPRVEDPLSAPG